MKLNFNLSRTDLLRKELNTKINQTSAIRDEVNYEQDVLAVRRALRVQRAPIGRSADSWWSSFSINILIN